MSVSQTFMSCEYQLIATEWFFKCEACMTVRGYCLFLSYRGEEVVGRTI